MKLSCEKLITLRRVLRVIYLGSGLVHQGLEGPEEQTQEEVWLAEEGFARISISIPRGAEWEGGICQLQVFILWEENRRGAKDIGRGNNPYFGCCHSLGSWGISEIKASVLTVAAVQGLWIFQMTGSPFLLRCQQHLWLRGPEGPGRCHPGLLLGALRSSTATAPGSCTS